MCVYIYIYIYNLFSATDINKVWIINIIIIYNKYAFIYLIIYLLIFKVYLFFRFIYFKVGGEGGGVC